MSETITLKLKGNPDDPDLVEAGKLAEFLGKTARAIRSIARDLGGEKSIRVLVTGLKAASAEVTLEIRRKRKSRARARPADVVELFNSGSRALALGAGLPASLSRESVQRIGEIADVVGHGVTATVGLNGTALQVTEIWKERASGGKDLGRAVEGRLRGHLEGIDVHGERRFFLYPVLSERRIECHFREAELEQVKRALGRYVAVDGIQKFAPDAPWPERIDVDAIEVYPVQETIPNLGRLSGLLHSLRAGLTVEEHVRRVDV